MKKKYILFFVLIAVLNYAQQKENLYAVLNINQEVRDNVPQFNDSTTINDFRFSSSLLIGHDGIISSLHGKWSASYENRYQKYFKSSSFTRMEHLIKLKALLPVFEFGSIYFYDLFKFRDYPNIKQNNYLRNIFNLYLKTPISQSADLFIGYRNWVKSYPNSLGLKDYSSHRPYLKINYHISETTLLGSKAELQFHRGTLYPQQSNIMMSGELSGTRYLLEIFGNKVVSDALLLDITFKLEYDLPTDINNNQTGNNQSDEEPEDLIIEDPDFDYLKNQITASILYRIENSLSIFGFFVFQNKDFNNWKISNKDNALRSDILFYSSLILKYKIRPEFKINLNYIFEKKRSNSDIKSYNRNIFGIGLEYNF